MTPSDIPISANDRSASPENPAKPSGSFTILVVEDEPLVLQMIGEMLQLDGFNIHSANSSTRALEIVRTHRNAIDLLLTDLKLPDMNGRQLYDEALKIHPKIEVLFSSGYPDVAIELAGIPDREKRFIRKPFDFDELTGRIRAILTPDA